MFWYFTIKRNLALENPTRFALHTFNEDHHLVRGEQLPVVQNHHVVTEYFQSKFSS